jgi:hypothetical protein
MMAGESLGDLFTRGRRYGFCGVGWGDVSLWWGGIARATVRNAALEKGTTLEQWVFLICYQHFLYISTIFNGMHTRILSNQAVSFKLQRMKSYKI